MIEVKGNLTSLSVSALQFSTGPTGNKAVTVTYWLLTESSAGDKHSHGPCELTFIGGQTGWVKPTESLDGLIEAIERNLSEIIGAKLENRNSMPEGLISKGF